MTTTITSPGTFSSFANISQTAIPGGCGPCTSAQLLELWRGSWTQNSSLPAIRTTQPIVDPVYNTTSTSFTCNTAALSAYNECPKLTLNNDCDFVCEYPNLNNLANNFTITLASPSGNYLQFANEFRIQGGVSTTDSKGKSICLTSFVTLGETSYTYAGSTSMTKTGMNLLVMPELTAHYLNEALFQQCTFYQTGPPPVALTAANELIRPTLTLPGLSTTTTQLSDGPTTTKSTAAQPADSNVDTLPSSTAPSTTSATDAQHSPEKPSDTTFTQLQPDDSVQPVNEPTSTSNPLTDVTSTETVHSGEEDDAPIASDSGTEIAPAQSDDAQQQDDTPVASPTIRFTAPLISDTSGTAAQSQRPNSAAQTQSGSDSPVDFAMTIVSASPTVPIAMIPGATFQYDESTPGVIVGGLAIIVAGGTAAVSSGTTFSVLPSSSAIVAMADGTTGTLPLSAPTTNVEQSLLSALTIPTQGFAIPGPTVTNWGDVVAVSGTTFSVLPSDSGLVAISGDRSTILQVSQLISLGISTVLGSSGAYILPSQTLAVDGSAIVISGTTYSAVPSSSGVVVAVGGLTNLAVITARTIIIPGIGEVSITNGFTDGYVLDGGVLALAGGPVVTILGAVYSALPHGPGILVNDTTEKDDFASYIEQGISGPGSDANENGSPSYVVLGNAVPMTDSDAVTVSGTVYSALPSGSGVLIVANGTSTTTGRVSTTHGNPGQADATATIDSSGNGTNESTVPYICAASPLSVYMA